MKRLLIVYVFIIPMLCGNVDLENDVASEIKGRLMRSIFKKENKQVEDKNVSVTWQEVPFTSPTYGRADLLLTPSPNRYYLSDYKEITQFQLKPNALVNPVNFKAPGKIQKADNTLRLLEMANWDGKAFLVSCYDGDYCDISEWIDEQHSNRVQSILFTYQPKFLKFFVQQDKFHMLVVGELSSIYRWMGSYFDEMEIWKTPGTRNVELFSIKHSLIMVFAQNNKKDDLCDVFVRKNEKTRLAQRLNSVNASFVKHYRLSSRHGDQNYIIIFSEHKENPTFWWNGRNFSPWIKLTNNDTPKTAYVSNFQSEPFLFVASKGFVSMYFLKTTEVQLVRTVKTDGDIVAFTAEDPNLVFLIARPSGLREIAVVSLKIQTIPKIEEKNSVTSCFDNLVDKIKQRDGSIDGLKKRKEKLLSTSEPAILNRLKSDAFVVFDNVTITTLNINPVDIVLKTTPGKLLKRIKELTQRLRILREKVRETNFIKKRIILEGDLFLDHIYANEVQLNHLNGRLIKMDDILSNTKNQHFSNPLKVSSIAVGQLETSLINQHSPEDLLVKKMKQQIFSGDADVKNLYASKIRFGEISKINGLHFDQIVTSANNKTIMGKKEVKIVQVEKLDAVSINNASAKTWVQSLFSPFSIPKATMKNLSVDKLSVKFINNLPWHIFVETVANQSDSYNVTEVTAKRINGIPIDNFLTLNGNQNIKSKLSVPLLKADTLKFSTLNNFTLEQVSKAFKSMQEKLEFNRPVQIEESLNASNVNFMAPAVVGNLSIDLGSIKNGLGENKSVKNHTIGKSAEIEKPQDLSKISKVTIFGDVKVVKMFNTQKINGDDVKSVLSNAIVLSENKPLENVKFQNIYVKNLTSKNYGGFDGGDFSFEGNLQLQTLHLKSSKQFLPNVKIDGNLTGMVNGVRLDELSKNILTKSSDQNLTAEYVLKSLKTNFLDANYINNIDLKDQMVTNTKSQQIITTDLFLNSVGVKGNLTVLSLPRCDLNKVAYRNLTNDLNIELLEIVGDLNWEDSKPEMKSLSHIFENAVTSTGDHVISGKTVFAKNVQTSYAKIQKLINKVDIDFIAKDAIFSSKENIALVQIGFKNPVTADDVYFNSKLSVDFIDDVDIIKFNEHFVRKDDNREVTGVKTLTKGFTADYLDAENVHDIDLNDVVYFDDYIDDTKDMRLLPKTTFKNLIVLSNLNAELVNGQNFVNFIDNIVKLNTNESFTQSIRLKGNPKIGSLTVDILNNVKLSDVVKTNETEQNITACLEFSETVRTANLNVKHVNDINLVDWFNKSLKTNQNETLTGNLVVNEKMVLDGNIDVEFVNECNLPEIYEIEESYNPMNLSHNLTSSTLSKINKVNSMMETRLPVLLKHFEWFSNVELNMTSVKFTSTQALQKGSVEINIYGMTTDPCGLTVDSCHCPRQSVITFEKSGKINVAQKTNRTYYYTDSSLQLNLKVFTTTISYSSRCKSLQNTTNEFTEIVWGLEETPVQKKVFKYGYLTDVRFFKLGNSVYIAAAFFFNGNFDDAHSLTVTVFELDLSSGLLTEIDRLPARGFVAIDVVWANPSYFLVIGNVRPDEGIAGSVKTEVFRFNEKLNKFQSMKVIRSHGVMDVKAIRIKKQPLIFIVQKNPWPLLAFKYNQESDNYLFTEKLYERVGFSSVSPIALTQNDIYIAVVYATDFFKVFSYKQIEGLVEETTVKQKNVYVLQHFKVNGDYYLLAISIPGNSVIYKIVVS